MTLIFSKLEVDYNKVPPFSQNESYLAFNKDATLSVKNYLAKETRKIWYPIFFGTSKEIDDLCKEYGYFNIAKNHVKKGFRRVRNFVKKLF